MKILHSLLMATMLPFLAINAQEVPKCSTPDYDHEAMLQDLEFQQMLQDWQETSAGAVQSDQVICDGSNTVIIPIAVHYNTPVTNDNPACLLDIAEAQIAVLNNDFGANPVGLVDFAALTAACPAGYPASTVPTGGGTCLQFCLASMNHPTGYGLVDGDPAITVGAHDWPDQNAWNGYLNLFVSGTNGGLGVSWLPGDGNGDGFWCTYTAFGGPGVTCNSGVDLNTSTTYGLGKTATHEAGHYFGLPHTFSGNCNDGDFNTPSPFNISDTPPEDGSFFGCPSVNDCASGPTSCNGEYRPFWSFMDYTDDACYYTFSNDQATVMNWVGNDINWVDNVSVCQEATPPPPPPGEEEGISSIDDPCLCYFFEGTYVGAHLVEVILTGNPGDVWTFEAVTGLQIHADPTLNEADPIANPANTIMPGGFSFNAAAYNDADANGYDDTYTFIEQTAAGEFLIHALAQEDFTYFYDINNSTSGDLFFIPDHTFEATCSETNCSGVPTASEWGLFCLALCLLSLVVVAVRKRETEMVV